MKRHEKKVSGSKHEELQGRSLLLIELLVENVYYVVLKSFIHFSKEIPPFYKVNKGRNRMRYISSLGLKKKNWLSLTGATFVFIVLCCLMFSACDTPAGVNSNGSNNGNYNGQNNGNNNNNCNGVNNCNIINPPSAGDNSTSGGGNTSSGTTQQQPPSTGSSSPIAEGDFLYNPGSVSGPAIVEYWNGLGGAGKICGTFQLPSGESFTYKAGHWWRYDSDQSMQSQWSLHIALYQQKSENAGCSIGQRP